MNGNEEFSFRKTGIITLAVISLFFRIVEVISSYIGLKMLSSTDASFATVIISYILPILISVLFAVFCIIANRKNVALTGIPIIAFAVWELCTSVYTLFVVYDNVNTSVPATLLNFIPTVVRVILLILFAVFYMLAVTNKFKGENTGKKLTLIFGIILIAISIIGTLVSVYSYFSMLISPNIVGTNWKVYYGSSLVMALCDFMFRLFMYFAMIFLVANVAKEIEE